MNASDRLLAAIERVENPTVMGLDTQKGHLPAAFAPCGQTNEAVCDAILRYNRALLDNMSDLIGVVKIQIAYYEMYGLAGLSVFCQTLRYAREKGYVTIVDAKRNDIGSTASAYATAFLGDGDFSCDFVTVNAYLGVDGVAPFVELAQKNDRGIFVLVKTSNPSGIEVQDLMSGTKKVYEIMADLVSAWGAPLMGERGYSSVGAVVGATWPAQSAELRQRMPHTPFLAPGYGAQGATGHDLRGCFDKNGRGAVVNASRSLLTAHQKAPDLPWLDAVRAEAVRMQRDLTIGRV
ncbi:MAG: orotidine-5'-phosphate decarboxylase [Oscillospiraceae bacterium]